MVNIGQYIVHNVGKTLISVFCKVEKILKGSLDSIQSPSPLVKTQITGRNTSFLFLVSSAG